LLVDTMGFNDAGLNAIPGGGVRGENSHLIEQYKLSGEGRKLQVTFTWIDDDVHQTSHLRFHVRKAPLVDNGSRVALRSDGWRASAIFDRPASAPKVKRLRETGLTVQKYVAFF